MNVQCLREAGIDYEAGLARFMNDPELYEAVLTAFADEDLPERAQAAFQSGDAAALLKAAHEAKGSGGNAGLGSVYREAGALTALLRGDRYTQDELAAAYHRFEAAYAAARDGVKAALGR